MDIRKVQITGGSSMMITLPKEWTEAVGLKKNDPVSLQPQSDGSLIIYTGGHDGTVTLPSKKIMADDIEDRDFLYRQLIGAYIAGHGTIELISETEINNMCISVASSFVQTAIGLEIMEESDNRIVIQDLMNPGQIRPMKSIDRMVVLVRNMLNDVLDSVSKKDNSLLNGMGERDREVDRIHWLILRQVSINQRDVTISQKQGLSLAAITRCSTVSRTIERIGDHAVLLSKNMCSLLIDDSTDVVDRAIVDAGREVISLFSDSVSTWKSKDMVSANECIKRGRELVEKSDRISKMTDKLTGKAAISTGLIAGSVRRIAEYSMDICEVAINAAME